MFSTTVKSGLITQYLCTVNPAHLSWESRSLFACAYSTGTNNYFIQHSTYVPKLETGYKKHNSAGKSFKSIEVQLKPCLTKPQILVYSGTDSNIE